MSDFLLRLYEKRTRDNSREGYGMFAGAVGLVLNLVLFGFKIAVGVLSSSISVIADAVNNLSDAASSAVTLFGFKMSKKPADKEHPFGHARVEYMSSAVIAIAILIIGAELLKSSVENIVTPEAVLISPVTLIVLGAAILVKLFMASFYRKVGKRINSVSLFASAADSRNDVFMTAGVLIGAAVQYIFKVEIDGYIGAVVALFILISGYSILKDSLSPLLGEAPSEELIDSICGEIVGFEGVLGIHDLVVHSYGPARIFATVHVEMSAKEDSLYCHGVLDNIERNVKKKLGVDLVIHLDPVSERDEEYNRILDEVKAAITSIDSRLAIHDFRISKTHDHINLIYDVEVPCDLKTSDEALEEAIIKCVKEKSSHYYSVLNVDRNYRAPENTK